MKDFFILLKNKIESFKESDLNPINDEVFFACPYCGKQNIIDIDISAGSKQQFIQDCEVCCRPIEVIVMINADGNVSVDVRNDEGF